MRLFNGRLPTHDSMGLPFAGMILTSTALGLALGAVVVPTEIALGTFALFRLEPEVFFSFGRDFMNTFPQQVV